MTLAYKDGNFVEAQQLTVNPADYGFARGVTVFELVRVYESMPFRLEDHVERMIEGAEMFGINRPGLKTELLRVGSQLPGHNKFPHSVVKFYLTAGECGHAGGVGFADDGAFTPHLMVLEAEVKPMHPEAPKGMELYRQGINLKTVPFSRHIPTVKTINYAPGFWAAREAKKEGADEILFVHPEGYITETTTGNLFAVIDGKLCTPKNDMLYGVTRKVLMELAGKLKIAVTEMDIKPSNFARATEAFVTGSFVEMLPVRNIDEHTMRTTTDGPVYKQLRQALTAYIKESQAPLARVS